MQSIKYSQKRENISGHFLAKLHLIHSAKNSDSKKDKINIKWVQSPRCSSLCV